MLPAIFRLWDSRIISLIPQRTSVGIVIRANSSGLTLGSFTIRPSISAFFRASAERAAKCRAIR